MPIEETELPLVSWWWLFLSLSFSLLIRVEGVITGRRAIGFAIVGTKTLSLPSYLWSMASPEFIGRGAWLTIVADGGVVSRAGGCKGAGGGVIASIPVGDDIPKSNQGASCGGDSNGVDTDLAHFVFFFRYSGMGSLITRRIFEPTGVLGTEGDCIENLFMSGGDCNGFGPLCFGLFSCTSREGYVDRDDKKGMRILGGGVMLIEEGILLRPALVVELKAAPLLRGGLGFNLILGVLVISLSAFFPLLFVELSEGG